MEIDRFFLAYYCHISINFKIVSATHSLSYAHMTKLATFLDLRVLKNDLNVLIKHVLAKELGKAGGQFG